jgi:hypothetical protein
MQRFSFMGFCNRQKKLFNYEDSVLYNMKIWKSKTCAYNLPFVEFVYYKTLRVILSDNFFFKTAYIYTWRRLHNIFQIYTITNLTAGVILPLRNNCNLCNRPSRATYSIQIYILTCQVSLLWEGSVTDARKQARIYSCCGAPGQSKYGGP